jgi:hypothetical protein
MLSNGLHGTFEDSAVVTELQRLPAKCEQGIEDDGTGIDEDDLRVELAVIRLPNSHRLTN